MYNPLQNSNPRRMLTHCCVWMLLLLALAVTTASARLHIRQQQRGKTSNLRVWTVGKSHVSQTAPSAFAAAAATKFTQQQTAAETQSSAATNPTDLPEPQGCPEWMPAYAEFHRQQRGQPGARYLIHSVGHGMSGLGDRIRGMLFTARLAASSGRVVLFTWQHDPAEPQDFLAPAGSINWTLQGTGYDPAQHDNNHSTSSIGHMDACMTGSPGQGPCPTGIVLNMYTIYPQQQQTLQRVKQGLLQRLGSVQYVTLHTNERAEAACVGCPDLDAPFQLQESATGSAGSGSTGSGSSSVGTNSAACLFRLLFKPSATLEAAVLEQLLQLFGPDSRLFSYAAAHLRLGGLGHECGLRRDRGTGRGELADTIAALTCARRLGQQAGMEVAANSSVAGDLKAPVLLITDQHMLRSFVLSGGLAHAVTPKLLPVHLARLDQGEKGAGSTAALSTFIDLLLLAKAQCLVASDSGFSEAAWMLGGGRACVAQLNKGRKPGGSSCDVEGVLGAST